MATTASRSSRRIARTSVEGRVTATMVSARDEGASKRAQAIPQTALGRGIGEDRRGWIDQDDLRGTECRCREVPAKCMRLCLAEYEIGGGHRHLAETTLADYQARGATGDRTECPQRLAQQLQFARTAAGGEDHHTAHVLAQTRFIGGLDVVSRSHVAHSQAPRGDTHDPEQTFAARCDDWHGPDLLRGLGVAAHATAMRGATPQRVDRTGNGVDDGD